MIKLLAFLLVSLLATTAYAEAPMTYEQLSAFKVNSNMCPRIDEYVTALEHQLALKRLTYATPEELNDADRKYNAEARIAIWALRIGCNNPDRYK